VEAKANGRKHRSAGEWREIFDRHAASGLSQVEFCHAEGIARSSFDTWRRKLGSKKSARPAAREFVEVAAVPARAAGGWMLELELPDGRVARLRC
jgi:hypothetical protein